MHPVPADSRAIVRTAGGGGWGNPLERDPEKVRMDVMEGFVSVEAARSEYGVVFKPNSDEHNYHVDAQATKKSRAEMKKKGR